MRSGSTTRRRAHTSQRHRYAAGRLAQRAVTREPYLPSFIPHLGHLLAVALTFMPQPGQVRCFGAIAYPFLPFAFFLPPW